MFFKRKIYWFLVFIILSSLSSEVSARTSHDVSIRIAEIGRYYVENKSVVSEGGNLIQTVEVVILSNSDRKWRFVAVPSADCTGMEWSRDNRVWNSFEDGIGEVLTGGRSDWQSYRFYIKVNGNMRTGINIGYQLLFNE